MRSRNQPAHAEKVGLNGAWSGGWVTSRCGRRLCICQSYQQLPFCCWLAYLFVSVPHPSPRICSPALSWLPRATACTAA
jgi:hypothetical protein